MIGASPYFSWLPQADESKLKEQSGRRPDLQPQTRVNIAAELPDGEDRPASPCSELC